MTTFILRSRWFFSRTLTAFVLLTSMAIAPVWGFTDFWTGAVDSNWNTNGNWNGGFVPQDLFDVGLINIDGPGGGLLIDAVQTVPLVDQILMGSGGLPANDGQDATITHAAGDVILDFLLSIGHDSSHTGTYTWNMSNGSLSSSVIIVGNDTPGLGRLLQSGGSVGTLQLDIGGTRDVPVTAGNGLYEINNGNLSVTDFFGIRVGNNPGSTGTLKISGASVVDANATNSVLDVGRQGTGLVEQSGGEVNIGGVVTIGDLSDSVGTYDISGGTLRSGVLFGELVIGNEVLATGTLNASGTAVVDTGPNPIVLGEQIGSAGMLTVSDDAVVTTADNSTSFALRVGDRGSGTVIQTGGLVEATGANLGFVEIGLNMDSDGTYDISDGTLRAAGKITLGRFGTGTLLVSGGTVEAGTNMVIGDEGTGMVTQSGGTVDIANIVTIGGGGSTLSFSPGIGSYSISDGMLDIETRLMVGRGNSAGLGSGTLTQTGGDVSAGEVHIGGRQDRDIVGDGTYEISGGTLAADDPNPQFFDGGIVVGTENGSIGALHASGTAQVTSVTAVQIGVGFGSTGEVSVADAASVTAATDLRVGVAGTGNFSLIGPDVTVTAAGLSVGALGRLEYVSGSGISTLSVTSASGTSLAGNLLLDLTTLRSGQDLLLVENVNASASVAGIFTGLPEGSAVPGTGLPLDPVITYVGGEGGNDILLTNIAITGDMDCDGDVDFDDIAFFVLGLNDAAEYEDQIGLPPDVKGDTDNDGDFDFDDIPGFVDLLTGARLQAVPEPSSLALASLVAASALVCRLRRPSTDLRRRLSREG